MALRLHCGIAKGRLKGKLMKPGTIGLTLLVAAVAPAMAQEHAHYVNARTYLRTAQILMQVPERPNVQLRLKPADDELDAAVREIDRAGVVGRQDAVDHPAIKQDPRKLDDVDRFRSIVDLLHSARNEIQQEADNTHTEWRSAAQKHISAALESVHKAAIDAHLDREIGDF
jgi:hypothetical protein